SELVLRRRLRTVRQMEIVEPGAEPFDLCLALRGWCPHPALQQLRHASPPSPARSGRRVIAGERSYICNELLGAMGRCMFMEHTAGRAFADRASLFLGELAQNAQ